MKRRARTVVLALSACLAAGLIAVFVWLPWNPFEDDAGPLDEWVPADVDALFRFDARALREAAAARTLWDGPAGRRLRDDFDLDEKLDELRRLDAQLATSPFAGDDPPTVERDFLGGEALVALRGDDVLAMSRISARAKAIDLIRRAGDERRARWGVRVDGDAYVVSVGDGREAWFARRRDVLIVSTSREMLASAVALADGAGASIVEVSDYRAVRPEAPSRDRASVWVSGAFLERRVPAPKIVRTLLQAAFEHGVAADVDLTSKASIRASARVVGGKRNLPDVGSVEQLAGTLAWRDEAFAVGALPLSAEEAVAALLDSQPESRRTLVESLLAESGSSVEAVAADLARHFAPGVGFVVARLPETGRLKLDDADGDPVVPIPATVAVFRLADPDAEPFLADLRRHAAALFGPDARFVEQKPQGPVRRFVAPEASFGVEWAMLRPAITIQERIVVFSTNEAYLRREDDRGVSRFHKPLPTVAVLHVEVANLAKRLDDLRWEAADRATYRDWAAERRAVREELMRQTPTLSSGDAERREDAEIERRMQDRRRRLFPRAVREYRESLRWLDAFTQAGARAWDDGGVLRIDLSLELRVP